jgi:predicted acylesterase/phospholipase RssA
MDENTVIIQSEVDTLVLSGGSINGFILLGGIQYLYDNHLFQNITTFVGTSIGSIISYLLIIGYTPIEIMVYLCTHNELIEKMGRINILNIPRGEAAVPFSCISDELERMTIDKMGSLMTMAELNARFGKILVCSTYNATKSKPEYISHETYPNMPCLTAMKMSSNLPFIFENFKYGDSFYIDGGVSNNFPIDIGEKLGKKVVGLCITYDLSIKNIKPDFLDYIYKLLYVPIQQSMEYRILNMRNNTKVINISPTNIDFFNFNINHKVKFEMFSNGYNEVKNSYISL